MDLLFMLVIVFLYEAMRRMASACAHIRGVP